jgi:hypothetical protein
MSSCKRVCNPCDTSSQDTKIQDAKIKALHSKWTKLKFAEEAFWKFPDLVSFVFESHLHRHITHAHYQHQILMKRVLIEKGGRRVFENHPHLLGNGRYTSWSEIEQRIKVDKDQRLYSVEGGKKRYWMYLDKGLTKGDKNRFDTPRRLYQLQRPPLRTRVEVITTHAHPEDWHLGDRVLKGTRHTYFRIVPGRGFSARNPGAGLTDGSVYSIGWGAKWSDFSFYQPLSTICGNWISPDNFEFYKEDLFIKPIEVSDEKALKLLGIIKKRSREDHPFNILTENCCGGAVSALKEAEIIDIQAKSHLVNMLYKFIVPKILRRVFSCIARFLALITPTIIVHALNGIAKLIYSIVFAPLFTLLGAWRKNLVYEEEDGIRPQVTNQIKALFSSVFDLFQPNKLEIDLTKNVYKWQKKQADSFYEKRN